MSLYPRFASFIPFYHLMVSRLSEITLRNILAKNLVLYIPNLPEDIKYIFWTHIAGAHYSLKVVLFLNG